MKIISDLSAAMKNSWQSDKPVLCEYFISPTGTVAFDSPILSTDHKCMWCGGIAHYTPFLGNGSMAKSWLCANIDCLVYNATKMNSQYVHTAPQSRELEWGLFCEINNIGDIYWDVRFESVDQNEEKLKYMLEYVKNPHNILLMQGNSGTGKTYAALGMCELFTRKSRDAIFIKQKKIYDKWLDTFKSDKYDPFIDKITGCQFLVIDDFGVAELTAPFMAFLMDLLDIRTQWINRGTVITTNLDNMKFVEYCGEALVNRIVSGQKFNFRGNSRRIRKAI